MGFSGKCLCGAVSYEVSAEKEHFGACHCTMCRRWSGGVFMSLEVQPNEITFKGGDALCHYASSEWAERAFCSKCGANLYYRVTAPGPYQGAIHLGAGTLDDHGDLTFTEQLFVDIKPKAYGFAQKTKDYTEAQVMEMFGDLDS